MNISCELSAIHMKCLLIFYNKKKKKKKKKMNPNLSSAAVVIGALKVKLSWINTSKPALQHHVLFGDNSQ